MEFTPDESKVIERLRKQERKWKRDRWIVLVVGAFIFITYSWIVLRMTREMELDSFGEVDILPVAVFRPKCLLMFCVATYFICWAIRDWHGNANRRLLLRLLEPFYENCSRNSGRAALLRGLGGAAAPPYLFGASATI